MIAPIAGRRTPSGCIHALAIAALVGALLFGAQALESTALADDPSDEAVAADSSDAAGDGSSSDEESAAGEGGSEDIDEELADAQAAEEAAREAIELGRRLGGNRGILPSGIDPTQATYVSIARLARADESLDNTVVSFRGEAVGEPIRSSVEGRNWVTMHTAVEGTSAIGVLMDDDQVSLVSNWGAYGIKGTTLLVTGIYRVADPNQSGTLDVTAYDVRVLEEGGALPVWLSPKKLWLGIALTILGIVLTGVNVYMRKRVRS